MDNINRQPFRADSAAEKRLREQLMATYGRRRAAINLVHYLCTLAVVAAATAVVATTTMAPTPASKCGTEQRTAAFNIINQTIALS